MQRSLRPAALGFRAAAASGAGASDRTTRLATLLLPAGFALMAASVTLDKGTTTVAVLVAGAALMSVWHRTLLRWPVLVGLLVSIMLFVPVGRFSIPVGLPFGLELYRLTVFVVVACWVASLLVDSRVSLRRTPFDKPVALVVCATFASIAVNPGRVAPLGGAVLKSLTYFLSFVLVYYFIVSVVRRRSTVERLTKLFVAGTAVTAGFAILEQRTGFNVFDQIGILLPFLQFEGESEIMRYGLVRAVGSSSHPIELGMLLALALPLSLALTFSSSRRWWITTALLAVAVMAAASRTPILVLGTAAVVLYCLRPREIRRLLPLLVPLIVIVKLTLPGSLATLKVAFFPPGGLIKEHAALAPEADPLLAGGRIRLLGPTLNEATRTPIFGQGFATRQTGFTNPLRNAPILDNQWLGLLLEVGLVGVFGWVALIVGAGRRLGRESRLRAGPDGWLPAGFAAAITSFGVGMLTFDALAFTQVTFVFWVMIALASSLLLAAARETP